MPPIWLRKLVHASLGLGALLLPYFTAQQHLLIGVLAATACALFLPGMPGQRLTRRVNPALAAAVLFYVLGVLLLIVAFPMRLDLAAAGWGILAAGDAAATMVGRRWRGTRWPWNGRKSVAGSIAFVIAGASMGIALAWALRTSVAAPAPLLAIAGATVGAALLAALVETLPIRLDDNLSVSAAAALALYGATLIVPDASAAWPTLARTLPIGLAINAAFAIAVWRARGVSTSGAIAGTILGALIYAGAGWAGWAMLILAFGAAWGTSRIGLARKRVLGIDEAREGRRGAENAIANCGLAAAAALAAVLTPYHDLALLALTTALTAGASDTVASEIGKAWGGHTWLVTTLSRVPPGTPGAISLEGTAAGIAAAFVMGSCAWAVGLIPLHALWIVVVASTAGAFVESALAATLEAHHILDNHLLNFLNTLVAVICAIGLS